MSAKHHVFLIHGIGSHSENWVDDADIGTTLRKQLESSWNLVSGNQMSFDQVYDLIPICYDSEFTKLYASWEASVKDLRSHLSAFPNADIKLKPLVDLVAAAPKGSVDGKFFYTHVLDLLWYWGNWLLRDKIIAHVGAQIMAGIEKYIGTAGHQFSIIAHSMGTSVIHKTLQALYTQKEYQDVIKYDLKFSVLMQVVNTSYVLSDDRSTHYGSEIVRPSVLSGGGCCNVMINASNQFDLISEVFPFAPAAEHWLDASTYPHKNDVWFDIRPAAITDRNVHSICHYFQNPAVFVPFFERSLQKPLNQQLKDKAIAEFNAGTPAGKFKALKEMLTSMRLATGATPADFIKSAIDYVTYLRAL